MRMRMGMGWGWRWIRFGGIYPAFRRFVPRVAIVFRTVGRTRIIATSDQDTRVPPDTPPVALSPEASTLSQIVTRRWWSIQNKNSRPAKQVSIPVLAKSKARLLKTLGERNLRQGLLVPRVRGRGHTTRAAQRGVDRRPKRST